MKIQVLYPIFNLNKKQKNNLILSIKSLKRQNTNNEIEFCFSDMSDVEEDLSFLRTPHKKYFEENSSNYFFPKPIALDNGIKKLITTEYFIVSDVDIIYPADFVEKGLKFSKYYDKSLIWPTFIQKAIYRSDKESITKEKELFERGLDYLFEIFSKEYFTLIYAPSLFLRKSDVDYIGGLRRDIFYRGYEDFDFQFRLKINNLLKYLPDLYGYTYHMNHILPLQESKNFTYESFCYGLIKSFFNYQKRIINYLEDKESSRLKK